MHDDFDYVAWLRNQPADDFMGVIRNEVLDCNQTTRTNLNFILNVLESPHADMRLVGEYAERIRATADRLTSLMNAAAFLWDEDRRNRG
jgi:hypothetical protein